MAKAELTVQVEGLPRVRELLDRAQWRIDCLEAMLRRPACSQCGNPWLASACGPSHALIASAHPLHADPAEEET